MPTTSLTVDRCALAAAVVTTCALFTARAADPVNVVKLLALCLAALLLLGTAAYRATRYRVVHVPTGLAAWAGLALGAAFCVATVVAPVSTTAVLGTYGRNSGLWAYLSALVLFFVALRVLQGQTAAYVLGGVVLAGLFTATYGLLQKAGLDSIPWNNPFNPIIAGLGNPNFASGYLGIAAVAGVGGAVWAGWGRTWRTLSGATAGLCLLAASLSASVQGPIAAAGGLFVVAVAVSLNLTSTLRKTCLTALGALGALGAGVLLVGATAQAGPAARIFSDVGSEARTHYWAGALTMFQERPLLGVGLDQYGNFWRAARSPESVAALGGAQYSDAAHSVPLQMLAQGGIVLGLAYAGFVLLTATALVRSLWRLTGQDRVLLGALGGGWTAYQVQSFVSIDQVPLIVLHFTLAGAVFAAAGWARSREVKLPGAPVPVDTTQRNDARTKRRLASSPPPARSLSGIDALVLTGAAAGLLFVAFQSLDPLRANMAVKQGDAARRVGDGNGAFLAYDTATRLVPGQGVYWSKKGELFQEATPPQTAQALGSFQAALDQDPYDVNVLRAAGSLAEGQGNLETARRHFDRLAQLDPLNSTSLVAAATFELRHGGAAEARTLLEGSVRLVTDDASLWATLGDARAVLDDEVGARAAYDRALALDPTQSVALSGLDKLARD